MTDNIDVRIAREVMGWDYDHGMDPSTNVCHAFDVVDRMIELDWRYTIGGGPSGHLAQFFRPSTTQQPMLGSDAQPLPLAICEAALAAIEGERDK